MFHLLFAVKTASTAPHAAHALCCLKATESNQMWLTQTVMYHGSCLEKSLTHTHGANGLSQKKKKTDVQLLQLLRFFRVGFPVRHESAYKAFHRQNHACHAISGGDNLLLIYRHHIRKKRAGG